MILSLALALLASKNLTKFDQQVWLKIMIVTHRCKLYNKKRSDYGLIWKEGKSDLEKFYITFQKPVCLYNWKQIKL